MFSHTTRLGKSGHRHLVYTGRDGVGACGEAKGHAHPVTLFQPTTVNFATLEDVPAGDPIWQIGEAEDGHTHDLLDGVEPKKDKGSKETESEKVETLRNLFKEAREHEKAPRKAAEEAWKFYQGEQWTDKQKSALAAKERACLTINHIEGAIDTLSGYFRQNRTDYKFWPVEDGDARVADIVTALVRNICDRNEFQFVETKVFEDETIAGRGLFHSYIDYDQNIRGDVVVEKFEWDDVYFGPHNREDASDCEHVHKSKWFSKEKLKNLYPDKADDIQADYDAYEDSDDVHHRLEGRQYEVNNNPGIKLSSDFVDVKKKEYCVIETEQKKYERIPVLVNAESGETFNASEWAKADIDAVKGIGWSVIYRPVYKMRITKIAGGVLLEDETVDVQDFSITPVYAKKAKDKWYGKIESAKDPQRELNKTRSHGVDIINRAIANGWFYDNRTFANPAQKRDFEKNATNPGALLEVADATRPPTKFEADPVPSALTQLQETSRDEVRGVLNVRPEVLDSQSASGLAMVEGKKNVLVGNEFLYDNMAQSKKRLGQRIVRLIQECYTPERMVRVLGAMNQRKPVEIGGKPYNAQEDGLYKQILENADLTQLDLVVGESQHSPNKQTSDFVMLLETARVTGGQGVPPETLIETSPLSEDKKQKCLQTIAAQKKAAAEAEQRKIQMEIEKSQPNEIKMAKATQQMRGPQPVPGIMPPRG